MRATRRAVLLAGAAATVAACTRQDDRDARPAPVDPDVALRAAAVAREQTLIAAYDAALTADPDGAALLGPLRAEHEAHLAALGATAVTAPAAPPSAPPTADPPSRAALAQAERTAAAAHAEATVAATAPLAAVLAQLAASEASHPVALA